jgi:hypothetical protein
LRAVGVAARADFETERLVAELAAAAFAATGMAATATAERARIILRIMVFPCCAARA